MDTDPELAERIRRLPTARMAQREAKKRAHRQRADWLDVNVAMMDRVLEAKFSQHRSLCSMLRDTGFRTLIEDSPVRTAFRVLASQGPTYSQIDSFWGIGNDGRGHNELGKALMRLREKLQARQRYYY